MKKMAFKSIRARLTFWFILLAVLPLLSGILITFFQQKKTLEEGTIDKLISIRDLKVQQVDRWVNERLGDLKVMSGDYEIRGLNNVFDKKIKSEEDIKKLRDATELLNRNKKNYSDYEELFIIDAITGKIVVSTNPDFIGENKSDDEYFTIPLEIRDEYIKDIYLSSSLGKPSMTFSIPIFSLEQEEHIIGILVVRIDLDQSLYSLLLNRTGLGETGETLIVNENIIALNELRWHENAPLNLVISAEPAVNAANGLTGITLTTDYRQESILAAYTYIPQTKWGFVCKQDLYELNAPIRRLMKNYAYLFLLSFLVIALIVFWLTKRISKPIIEMNMAAQKIKKGDYNVRTNVNTNDEMSDLSKSINEMSASIESRDLILKGVVDISEVMREKSSQKDFGLGLLKQLMEISGATMSTFYVLNEVTSEYEYFASVGANKELLSSFSADNAEGEFGNVLSRKGIYYLRSIPKDTKFKYKTTAGDAIPKEMITIPVMVSDIVVALISLVNIKKFSQESYHIVEQSWTGINTSYSNLMANERTRFMAEHLSSTNQQLEAQTEELQEQSEELQNSADELQRTSEELQEQNVELEAQRNQVEAANKMKSEFLSNMSHELRTPLNSIMALSRVLISQTSRKLSHEENNYLEIVERNGKRLLSLINDILDLSKIEAGKMEITPEFISLKPIINIVKENLYQLSEEKGLSLTLDLPNDLPQIETEESKVYQILTNIIGNAVKFTNKGSVDISVSNDAENIWIKIKDSGIGISKQELPHIFDEFRQADGSSSRLYEGTGLGLAIANKMTTILGGNIKVSSKLGEGSIFTIMLPIKWHKDILLVDSYFNKYASKLSLTKSILVVDDDPKIIKGISESLYDAGYNTIGAQSGKEALQLAEKHQPFAITLDIVMPEMDGWEVLQKLKNKSITKDIPVIIISVNEDKETGGALGAVGFVSKPLDQKMLMKEINKISASPETVMIVDDNDFELKHMAKILEAEEINILMATGGKECINLLKNNIPDILVLDLMMPDMDGFQVLEKIRKKPETKYLPVIVVTAKDLSKEDDAKLSGNVSKVITKSDTTPQDLHKEIKRIISGLEQSQLTYLNPKKISESRILIVEDNPEAIVQIKSVLEKEHYKVDVANGGELALDYMQYNIPDGIILDLMMPDIDGFEVLERLRGTEKTKNIPVLVLTAKDLTKKELARLSANNINQLIYKGDIDINGLISKVKQMLIPPAATRNLYTERSRSAQPATRNLPKQSKKDEGEPVRRSPKDEGGKPKVLIVEDNPDNMITLKAILKGKYIIAEAFDGERGLEMARSQLPNLILLDMALPKMSGEEILSILRKNKKTKNIPVIAVTAQAMKGDEEKFLKAGCDGYVSKPIDQEILLTEIERLLSS